MEILSNHDNQEVPDEDRVIYALTMENVFYIAEQHDIDRETIEKNIEHISYSIHTGLECNWYDVIEAAVLNIADIN